MIISRIANATRVIGANQGYIGLPLRDEDMFDGVSGHNVNVMATAWEPTPDELERLNKGAKIELRLFGTMHPPVLLSVGAVPDV